MDHAMLLRTLLLLAAPLLLLADGSGTPINKTWSEKLKKQLFTDYDKTIRPSEETEATTVNFGFALLNFDLCDATSVLTAQGWARFHWTDKKLRWQASDFGDVDVLHIPYNELWTPDVVLYNSVDNDIHQHGATYSIVTANGSVLWVPPTLYKARCKTNLRLWPFDRQVCQLVVGSWTQHVGQVDLQFHAQAYDSKYITENNQWYLLKVDTQRHAKKYDCCQEDYVDLTYTLVFQRRPETYKTLIMIPVFAVAFLTLSAFVLPPQAGEKVVLNCLTAVIICIVIFSISQKLPAIAFTPPLVLVYFGSSLLMVVIGLAEAVWVIKISRNYGAHPLPPFIKRILFSWLGSVILNGRQNVPKKDEEGQAGQPSGEKAEFHREWLLFAACLDRIFFVVYALIFLIKIVSFYVALA